jgi:dihydrofolate reductase
MKKVIVSMNVTLDGFFVGPNHDLEWHFQHWSQDMGQRLAIELSKADTILLGRHTYQAMAQYWPMKGIDIGCARAELDMVDMMNKFHKVVYSKTLTATGWNNSSVISGSIRSEIKKLKQVQGRNIMVYGSGQLVSALIQLHLVDEYQLWVHPVLLGTGSHLFSNIKYSTGLRLAGTSTFDSGVVLMNYLS